MFEHKKTKPGLWEVDLNLDVSVSVIHRKKKNVCYRLQMWLLFHQFNTNSRCFKKVFRM